MVAVVGIHGVAQQFRGGYQLGSVWYDALRDGLVAAGHPVVAEALAPTDVGVAFFGNLFRPRGSMAVQTVVLCRGYQSVRRDLLTAFFRGRGGAGRSLGVRRGRWAGRPAFRSCWTGWRSPDFARIAQRRSSAT